VIGGLIDKANGEYEIKRIKGIDTASRITKEERRPNNASQSVKP